MVEFRHHRARRRDRQHREACPGEMLEDLRERIGATEGREGSGRKYFAAVANRESLDWVVQCNISERRMQFSDIAMSQRFAAH